VADQGRAHRFRASDVELAGTGGDGELYTVRLPLGCGTVYVSDRAVVALVDRLDAAFIARSLNALVVQVGEAEAFGLLGRRGEPVELAPDGVIDGG
jgi:hypothetical protein